MLRAYGPGLLLQGLRRRDPARLDALAEQLVPPLSILTGLTTLALALTGVAGARAARRLAATVALGLCLYVAAGLRLVGARPRAYASLALSPVYMLWKVGIYAAALLSSGRQRWVRTERQARR